jgi:midasin
MSSLSMSCDFVQIFISISFILIWAQKCFLACRFTEIYVDEMEGQSELLEVVSGVLGGGGNLQLSTKLVDFYLEARSLAAKGELYDGANSKAHYNLRSLTRTLHYACFMIAQGYTADRSIYEGAHMVFATQLAPACAPLISKAIQKRLAPAHGTAHPSRKPDEDSFLCVGAGSSQEGIWLKKGPLFGSVPLPKYILTPSVVKGVRCIARAVAPRKYPVLLQGPTSAGKTSVIEYLAAVTGHKFMRINNHAHTDVQEYVGGYVSDETGRLVFAEGPLVQAMRQGHWLVLDELNLAPSDVLEMLNRSVSSPALVLSFATIPICAHASSFQTSVISLVSEFHIWKCNRQSISWATHTGICFNLVDATLQASG